MREAGLHVRWRDSEERRRRRSCEARAQDGFALSVGLGPQSQLEGQMRTARTERNSISLAFYLTFDTELTAVRQASPEVHFSMRI